MQKYGQHFLINESVIAQIVDAALLLRAENLVEIGPGKGALTRALVARGQRDFWAVEIDPEMVQFLQKNLPAEAAVKIVQQNFLSFDWDKLPQMSTEFVSNLPYIDAAEILDKVLSWHYFKTAVFMFQKEQAQRITALPSDDLYGPLSILTQLRARVSLVCNVGRGSFNPPPKVESRVLAFEKIAAPAVPWKKFKKFVESSFLHRRKTLLNALCLAGYEKEKILLSLQDLHLAQTIRPEQVAPGVYVSLFQRIS